MEAGANIYTTSEPTAVERLPWSVASPVTAMVATVRSTAVTLGFVVIAGTAPVFPAAPHVSGGCDVVDLDPWIDDGQSDAAELSRASEIAKEDGIHITRAAVLGAMRILRAVRAAGMTHERVVPDPEGGFGVYVFGADLLEGGARVRYARLGVSNDGEMLALYANRRESTHIVKAIKNLDVELRYARSFVS